MESGHWFMVCPLIVKLSIIKKIDIICMYNLNVFKHSAYSNKCAKRWWHLHEKKLNIARYAQIYYISVRCFQHKLNCSIVNFFSNVLFVYTENSEINAIYVHSMISCVFYFMTNKIQNCIFISEKYQKYRIYIKLLCSI